MIKQLHKTIEETISSGSTARVFPVMWQGQRVWVKQATPSQEKGLHRIQRFVARITGISILRPTVSPGGRKGLKNEVHALRRLAADGVRVPTVLSVTDQWIVMGDNGRSLQKVMDKTLRAGDENRVIELVAAAGQALSELHSTGLVHGAPLLRNITLGDNDAIGFIDFEEDSAGRMPLAEAQARDALLFVFSIGRGFRRYTHVNKLVEVGWHTYLEAGQVDAVQMKLLRRILRVILPFYVLLRPFRRWLGTDARSALLSYGILRRSLGSH